MVVEVEDADGDGDAGSCGLESVNYTTIILSEMT